MEKVDQACGSGGSSGSNGTRVVQADLAVQNICLNGEYG